MNPSFPGKDDGHAAVAHVKAGAELRLGDIQQRRKKLQPESLMSKQGNALLIDTGREIASPLPVAAILEHFKQTSISLSTR